VDGRTGLGGWREKSWEKSPDSCPMSALDFNLVYQAPAVTSGRCAATHNEPGGRDMLPEGAAARAETTREKMELAG
jgi:hypothetical protein